MNKRSIQDMEHNIQNQPANTLQFVFVVLKSSLIRLRSKWVMYTIMLVTALFISAAVNYYIIIYKNSGMILNGLSSLQDTSLYYHMMKISNLRNGASIFYLLLWNLLVRVFRHIRTVGFKSFTTDIPKTVQWLTLDWSSYGRISFILMSVVIAITQLLLLFTHNRASMIIVAVSLLLSISKRQHSMLIQLLTYLISDFKKNISKEKKQFQTYHIQSAYILLGVSYSCVISFVLTSNSTEMASIVFALSMLFAVIFSLRSSSQVTHRGGRIIGITLIFISVKFIFFSKIAMAQPVDCNPTLEETFKQLGGFFNGENNAGINAAIGALSGVFAGETWHDSDPDDQMKEEKTEKPVSEMTNEEWEHYQNELIYRTEVLSKRLKRFDERVDEVKSEVDKATYFSRQIDELFKNVRGDVPYMVEVVTDVFSKDSKGYIMDALSEEGGKQVEFYNQVTKTTSELIDAVTKKSTYDVVFQDAGDAWGEILSNAYKHTINGTMLDEWKYAYDNTVVHNVKELTNEFVNTIEDPKRLHEALKEISGYNNLVGMMNYENNYTERLGNSASLLLKTTDVISGIGVVSNIAKNLSKSSLKTLTKKLESKVLDVETVHLTTVNMKKVKNVESNAKTFGKNIDTQQLKNRGPKSTLVEDLKTKEGTDLQLKNKERGKSKQPTDKDVYNKPVFETSKRTIGHGVLNEEGLLENIEVMDNLSDFDVGIKEGLLKYARENNIIIGVRPTSKYAKAIKAKGLGKPKPVDIEAKTANEWDSMINQGLKDKEGFAVIYDPKDLGDVDSIINRIRKSRSNKLSAKDEIMIRDRYEFRKTEFKEHFDYLNAKKNIKIDQDGFIIHVESNTGFYGDTDLLIMMDKHGNPLSLVENKIHYKNLRSTDELDVEHDTVWSWNATEPSNPHIAGVLDEDGVLIKPVNVGARNSMLSKEAYFFRPDGKVTISKLKGFGK